MKNNRSIGKDYEKLAVDFLVEHGLKILKQNYYCKFGELDIIAEDEGTIVFIEVKYRSSDAFGLPFESVNLTKQRKMRNAASVFILEHGLSDDIDCRFDVISISGRKIDWLKDVL